MNFDVARWKSVALGEVCEFRYGKSLPASSRVQGPFAVYGSNGQVGTHTAAITHGSTIVVGRKGSLGEVTFSSGPCWPIDTTYYIDETATEADLRWLAYRLRALGLTAMNKAAAVPGLNRDDAYRKRLLLPPIEAQRRIAEVLDRADTLRTKRGEALTHLDDLTQSIFLDKFGDPMVNERRQALCPLIEWVDPERPITYGILKPGPDQSDGVKYVRVVDMKDGGIDPSGVKRTTRSIADQYKRSTLRTGDLLISIRGHVGRAAAVPASLDGANITQDTARLAIAPESSAFVMECLRTDAVQRWMSARTKGVAVQGINLGDLKQVPIPSVAVDDQHEFAQLITRVSELRARARRQMAELDALLGSLQRRAFSGLL